MIEAFRSNGYKDASERIDIAFLDSVLKTELKGDKLPSSYQFTITDTYNDPVKFKNSPSHYTLQLDTIKSHSTLLFPSNSLDEDLFLHLTFPKQKTFLYMEMWAPLLVNLLLVALIIWALVFMFKTILTQKKLSEMKNDFISNMTHEFKTPISTISLACQAMNDSDMVGPEGAVVQPYVKMINDENQRLSLLVERILQSATLDRGELKIRPQKILLNEIIHDIAHHAQFRIQHSEGSINIDLPT
jgi:two-component system phosphate regulon sensor histidine kinase PhoR